jgi:hypothetical protein
MARVDLSDGWAVSGSVGGLQAVLRGFFEQHKMRVIGEQAGEMHVRQGFPWLTRVTRGWLTPSRWLPKRAVVKLNPAEGGVALRASIEEASPLRALSPRIQERYRTYFAWWMAELKSQVK